MTFPQTPLDVRTELQVGGTWTDISSRVYTREPITIARGSADEAATTEPSTCSMTLNNRGGLFSPRNPMSEYYGLIGRNTPVRVSVQGPESYMLLDGTELSGAGTADAAALDITGDIDIRVEATVDWYASGTHTLIGKWESSVNQRSYLLQVVNGALDFYFSPTGANSFHVSRPLPPLPPRAAVRATLDVNNGAGGWTVNLYWAESLDGPWNAVAESFSYTVDGPTTIFASTSPLLIAPTSKTATPNWLPAAGRYHRAEVRNGINGTVVASPDFRSLAPGATSFADSAGRTWLVSEFAPVSDRAYRFTGEISTWPARWDVSGQDVWVPVEAAGVTRRLGQGQKGLASTLRRRIPSDPNLIAYWPMEDGQDATAAYSPLDGVRPLTMTGWDFAADDSLGGSSPLPKASDSATLRGAVPRSSTQGWQVEYVFFLPTMPAIETEILRIGVTGASTMRTVRISASTAGVRVAGINADGDTVGFFLYTDAGAIADFWGKWNRLAIYTVQDGATVFVYVRWLDIAAASGWIARTSFTGTQGAVTEVAGTWGANTAGMVMGHLAVFDVPAQSVTLNTQPGSRIFDGADDGFNGETTLTRLSRLGAEETAQVAVSWRGEDSALPSQRLGPQRPATLMELLEECASTDGGILYEHLDYTTLVYRARSTLYNQPVALALDYTARGEVPPPLEPTEDDQLLRNDVTVTRSGGSSGRAVVENGPLSVQPPPAGVGIYDESVTLNLYSDDQPQPIAEWRTHLGTWDEARYPTISVWLHAAPHLIYDVLGLDIGDRIQISNPPAWLPPGVIDQHVRGYTEVLGLYEWSLTMNCAPAGPWTVGVVGDPVLGRADTDNSQLWDAVDATATSWSVAVWEGPLWITTALNPTEFPFDVVCGGEVVTVTGITGTSAPQTFTVTRSVNGVVKAHGEEADIRLAQPTIVAL